MTTHDARTDANGFVRFFRNYTKTWVHAVATAGLTAFGTLTIVHNWFAALALATYAVPPVVLYLRRGRARPRDKSASATGSNGEDGTGSAGADGSDDGSGRSSEARGTDAREDSDAAATADTAAASASDAVTDTSTETGKNATTGDTAGTESEATADQEAKTGAGTGEPLEGAETESTAADADDDAAETESDDDRAIPADAAADDGRDEASIEEPKSDSADAGAEWHGVDTPAETALYDVAIPTASDAYAVGADGTVLSGDGQGQWSVVLEDGPAAQGNDLRGADATADGEAVWIAGDSGALGRVDVETGRHTDYTAPEDVTDNWLGVAVGGSSDAETILLINGSGAVLRGTYREGDLEWTGPDKPGSGSSLSGVELVGDVGYCCDTNDGVFETTDGGESFERVGLEGADGTLTDVATTGRGDCLVSADDGVVHRYGGSTWTPERVADGSLTGLARSGERTAACADDGIHERSTPTADWERIDIDGTDALQAISIAPERSVAVGENGTVIERH
ncbi:hypothetical protein GS429_21330 [Natronorubrum sp. JWXQ-INN-674]|uniref:Photosynthesis system II assembly factor Ycf48/Hcf136-like domain-containing protein n=1 Tax=Natronorubrum halalkaliphilum TaxID=2691917 RepID=A0A6B0VVH0_9EURY|nr:hypothetical protein [Natronorubrum halalkaliphilum]MXV64569.1 hypothetical protein [Natronorubrum halalkaliphilum]